jgi:hypothetical protein
LPLGGSTFLPDPKGPVKVPVDLKENKRHGKVYKAMDRIVYRDIETR